MDLKVVATRKPGFTAPIAVALLWNPPGIASKARHRHSGNQNEALIPLNANNGAEATTWKIVVNGVYTEPPADPPAAVKGRRAAAAAAGRLTVSSQLAKLTVASQFLTLNFSPVSVEQGKEVDLPIRINKLVDFPGEAKVTLIGLPNKVTTEPVTITKDSTDVVFHVKTDPASPPGDTKSLFCEVVVMRDGEPIVHNLGTGRLRIDVPLPQKKKTATSAGREAGAGRCPLKAAQPLGEAPPRKPGTRESGHRRSEVRPRKRFSFVCIGCHWSYSTSAFGSPKSTGRVRPVAPLTRATIQRKPRSWVSSHGSRDDADV